MTDSSWATRIAGAWLRATGLVLTLVLAAGVDDSARAAGGVGDKPSQQPGPTVPGTATQPVAYPELHSVVLWLPQIKLNGLQPAQTPNAVPGGTEARGSVILTKATIGNAVITLASRNPALLHVPASITVPSGASSVQFRYDPMPVAAPTPVTVSASYRGQTKTASVTILPPQVQALTFDPPQLLGGQPARGTVTLSGRGPSGTSLAVTLSSNNAAAHVPPQVVLEAPAQQAQFSITTKGVGQQTPVGISASSAGSSKQATLTVMPAALRILGHYQMQGGNAVWWPSNSCVPQGQAGDGKFSGHIMVAAELTGLAPSDQDVVVKLESSNPGLLPVPATVTIPRNSVRGASQISCPSPSTESKVNVTGSYLGQKTYEVTVKPLPPQPDLQILAITLHDSAGNAIAKPTNPQPFKVCAAYTQHYAHYFNYITYFRGTKLRFTYHHSRGPSWQGNLDVSLWPASSGQPLGPWCHSVHGLELGEYMDITYAIDPDNVKTEGNEGNNRQQVRVNR